MLKKKEKLRSTLSSFKTKLLSSLIRNIFQKLSSICALVMEKNGISPESSDMQAPDPQNTKNTPAEEETLISTPTPSRKPPNLPSLQIPDRTLETNQITNMPLSSKLPFSPNPTSARLGLPPRPATTRAKSSFKNILSFKGKNTSNNNVEFEGERSVLILQGEPSSVSGLKAEKEKVLGTSRRFSLTRAFSSVNTKRTHSLPVTPASTARNESHVVINVPNINTEVGVKKEIRRSFSVPGNVKNIGLRRMDSSKVIRVVPVTPRPVPVENSTNVSQTDGIEELSTDDGGEDIPEEEAVCRICFIELTEGGETLKMECSCKGELALAHQECAIKWFSIKGNNTCDVCKQDIKNLPVTLLRIPSNRREVERRRVGRNGGAESSEEPRYRVYQDVPILIMVSMLAYFCFLEQLLVADMDTHALAISLPFSFVLGLLSSMIASTMVSRSYIWAYATFQFAIVILFAHVFYSVLKITAVLAILLSTFTGFGIAISINSLLVEYLRWKARQNLIRAQQNIILNNENNNNDTLENEEQQQQDEESGNRSRRVNQTNPV
ncbi:hypothetical protein LUZ60_017366 [Juncus effusus]|nr:hypothetical protein LUZ60_017366 [Juncus effusus]